MNDMVFKGSLHIRDIVGCSSYRDLFTKVLNLQQTITEYDTRQIRIPAGTVDLSIDFGGVSNVSFLYLQSTKPVTLKVNGSAIDTCAGTDFLLTGSSSGYLTSISVSNPGTDEADVIIAMGGNH